MDYTEIRYEVSERIATITLDCPERMNALGKPMVREWEDALLRATLDDDVRVVILTGEGRGFCAGANLKERAEEDARGVKPIDRRNQLRHGIHRVAQTLQYLDKPYLAAVNGAATGASAGDAARLVDPRNVAALSEAMGRLLSDDALRADLRARGLERAKQFSWQRTARETLSVYESVAAKS